MKFFESMSVLSTAQRKVSDTVAGLSVALAAVVALSSMPAHAQRMTGGGYNIPSNPSRTAPAQPTTTQYGTFRSQGPLPDGRVSVSIDGSFEHGQILGYEVYIQDNGTYGNDQIVVLGPEGREDVWVNCNVQQTWKSFGNNTQPFVHAVVSQWCGWDS